MSFEMMNYDEVLKQTNGHQTILLTGNGFSMAYNSERFSFTSLLDSAVEKDFIKKSTPLYSIFTKFDTKDFEEVVKLLETSVEVLIEYGTISEDERKKILEDSKNLKEYLVQIITNNHPDKITEISDKEFLCSCNFIKTFDLVFTLNYDLLLYWSTIKLKDFIKDDLIKDVDLKITDGFYDPNDGSTEYVIYANDSAFKQKINYLHGALHMYDKKHEIIKNTYSRTGKALKEQTLTNLMSDIYPIFVSEGTSEQKKARIMHNAYLNHTYKSFAKIGAKESSLIVFGTLLKTNDKHIRDAILCNKVKNIYFGISSEKGKEELAEFINELEKAKVPKQVFFYDYRTVKVWR